MHIPEELINPEAALAEAKKKIKKIEKENKKLKAAVAALLTGGPASKEWNFKHSKEAQA